ncbi:putative quinol monooxygenase [Aestuariispira ectoiniformans]|uniref:putative quinol monooxygenase n=1 Tax=Aestuariispira ectoiniformans TaxID=2775080 RepID=UPI00223AA147|nr:antibiotic biosynthesis monooxygenase [Aestuariispira ectoiniformans]
MTARNKGTHSQFLKVVFDVLPSSREAFIGLLESVQADLPTVPGCLGVRIFAHDDTPNRFTLIEEWDDRDLHQTHINGMVKSGAWTKIEAMLSQPPESQYLTPFEAV